MAETRYDVIFRGEIAAGHTVEDVKEKLAALYKGDHAKSETMFGGKTVVIKRNLDHQKALEMQAMLKARSGAICELRPITPAAPDPAETAPQTPEKPIMHSPKPTPPLSVTGHGERRRTMSDCGLRSQREPRPARLNFRQKQPVCFLALASWLTIFFLSPIFCLTSQITCREHHLTHCGVTCIY